MPGTVLTKEAMTLPAPSVTSNTGSAQHIKVLDEENRVKKRINLFMVLFFDRRGVSMNFLYMDTVVFDNLGDDFVS